MKAWRIAPLLALLGTAAGSPAATIPELYVDRCAHCHLAGIAEAPKVGDKAEWTRRVRAGMSLMYRSAIDGVPNTAMTAKGGHRDLSDDQVRAVVDYMVSAAGVAEEVLKAAARYQSLGITDRDFIRLDANYDGFLTSDELKGDPWLAKNLARFDENRDGKLSVAEYQKLEAGLERERAAVEVPDAEIVRTVRAALARVKGMPDTIKVESVAGVVTIAAVVADAETARQGYAAVRRIPGIRKIDDRLVSGALLSWD